VPSEAEVLRIERHGASDILHLIANATKTRGVANIYLQMKTDVIGANRQPASTSSIA
jgi:hypothetical protein